MVDVLYTETFAHTLKRLDSSIKEKTIKQIKKIIENPTIGKPLRYNLKGERTIYVKPFRIIYSYQNNVIYLLRLQHRDEVYE